MSIPSQWPLRAAMQCPIPSPSLPLQGSQPHAPPGLLSLPVSARRHQHAVTEAESTKTVQCHKPPGSSGALPTSCLRPACREGGQLPVVPPPILRFSSPGGETGPTCWQVSPGNTRIVQNKNLGYLQQHPGCPGGQRALRGVGDAGADLAGSRPSSSRVAGSTGHRSPSISCSGTAVLAVPSSYTHLGRGKQGGHAVPASRFHRMHLNL